MRDSILGRRDVLPAVNGGASHLELDGGGRRFPANAMTVGFRDNPNWTLKNGYWVRDEVEMDCLHESLEQSLPESQKDGAHGLVCTCPKCKTIC